MEALVGSILAGGLLVMVWWLVRRGEAKAVEAALNKVDAELDARLRKARQKVEKEIADEAKAIDGRTPSEQFDWLFETHTD